MIGDGISQITAEDVDALTRPFDLCTHVGGLDVTTSAGPIRVSHDFPSDYTRRVDQLLAGIFERNPAAQGTRPRQTIRIGSRRDRRLKPFRPSASVAKSLPMKWLAV